MLPKEKEAYNDTENKHHASEEGTAYLGTDIGRPDVVLFTNTAGVATPPFIEMKRPERM